MFDEETNHKRDFVLSCSDGSDLPAEAPSNSKARERRISGASVDPNIALEVSPYSSDRGELIGRDPREMTRDELDAAGIERVVGLKAIRAKCIDCSGGSQSEVRKCTVTYCPLWPLRMGTVPAAWRN